MPADGHLNLPPEKYTHEVRRLVSEDVTRSSYDEALEVLSERTAEEIAGSLVPAKEKKQIKNPRPENKRGWTCMERESDQVVEEIFKEAQARDPRHEKQWVE
jgi:hypothetical protein